MIVLGTFDRTNFDVYYISTTEIFTFDIAEICIAFECQLLRHLVDIFQFYVCHGAKIQ